MNNGIIEELGALAGDVSSQAIAINGNSQVVGWSGTRAFLWQTGSIFDLNEMIPSGSGWTLTTATGINDLGQIVGTGLFDGQTRAFLLTLDIGSSSGASPMPEPSTLSLLALGTAVGMRRLRGGQADQAYNNI